MPTFNDGLHLQCLSRYPDINNVPDILLFTLQSLLLAENNPNFPQLKEPHYGDVIYSSSDYAFSISVCYGAPSVNMHCQLLPPVARTMTAQSLTSVQPTLHFFALFRAHV